MCSSDLDGLRFLIPRSPKLQFVRAVLILGATSLFFTAIPHIPLANAIAINFLAPFLVVVFAIPMLGEKVEWQRWVVLVIGFSSTLLIIKPGMAGFHWASLLCCCSASCYALYQIVTRRLAAIDHPYTTLFFTGAAGVVASSVAVPFVWVPPTPTVWALLAIMGVIGGLSHFLLIQAYRYAAASTLAPFSYTQIVTGTLIGYVWFGTFPDGMAIVGFDNNGKIVKRIDAQGARYIYAIKEHVGSKTVSFIGQANRAIALTYAQLTAF